MMRNKLATTPKKRTKVRDTARLFGWIKEVWHAYAGRSSTSPFLANDGAFYFFLTILFFEVLITVLHAIWIVNQEAVLSFGVTVAAMLFIIGDTLYARYSYLHEAHAIKAEGTHGSFITLRRVGEFLGAAFVMSNGIILPTAAMILAWLRGPASGSTFTVPINSWAIAATTVAAGLIAATSYFKMKHYPKTAFKRRQSYNHILYVLAAMTQIELIILVAFSAFTGVRVPNDIFILLLVLLLGYVQHNHLLQQRFPETAQRRRGHIFALAVSFFTVAMIGFASLPNIFTMKIFPAEDIAALYLITIGIFFYGTSDRHRFRKKAKRVNSNRSGEIRQAEAFSEVLAQVPDVSPEVSELEPD